jgi:hypothetical protein
MTKPRLVLAEELEAIREEIALLKRRERTLASLEHAFPKVPVFRPAWSVPRVKLFSPAHA